jgi:CubicO group peptidase (beta-lactamase class C family)
VTSLRVAVECYAECPLTFEPGSKFEYNNPGINTVGRIIEVASGMPYEQFMAHRLFEPLGMKETTFWPSKSQLQRLAKTYKPNAANHRVYDELFKMYKTLHDAFGTEGWSGSLYYVMKDLLVIRDAERK